jgi:hypothetical protein
VKEGEKRGSAEEERNFAGKGDSRPRNRVPDEPWHAKKNTRLPKFVRHDQGRRDSEAGKCMNSAEVKNKTYGIRIPPPLCA